MSSLRSHPTSLCLLQVPLCSLPLFLTSLSSLCPPLSMPSTPVLSSLLTVLTSYSSFSSFLAVNASAQKLAIVFERMMLEVVLSWEAPLPFADSCHICRSLEAASEAKWVQCERCV